MSLHLSEVEKYLLTHWDLYEDMRKIEEQIDDKLAVVASRIRDKLRDHPRFPSDWTVSVIRKSIIEATREEWQQRGKKKTPLAGVYFWDLDAGQLVSRDSDERAVFDFSVNFPNDKDPRIKAETLKLTQMVTEHPYYIESESDRDPKGQLLRRCIDPISVRVLEDGQKLEDLVVDGLLRLIGDIVELIDKTGDVQ